MRHGHVFVCLLLALAQPAVTDEFDLGAHAKDLAITIRPHAETLVFGDPLFLEVSVVNRAKETIRAPAPRFLEFTATERESGLQMALLGPGWPPGLVPDIRTVSDAAYVPNQPMKRIEIVGLAGNMIQYVPKNIDDLGHPFWRRLVGGGELGIRCIFHFGTDSGLQIVSNEALVSIKPRPQKEIAALRELEDYDKPIGLNPIRERLLAARLAGIIKSGELAENVKLTYLMQQLKHDADINREAVSQQVLDWVAAQPDIKRQSMAQQLSTSSNQVILSPAALEKLREIAKQPVAPPAN